jgi:hypothetical protein
LPTSRFRPCPEPRVQGPGPSSPNLDFLARREYAAEGDRKGPFKCLLVSKRVKKLARRGGLEQQGSRWSGVFARGLLRGGDHQDDMAAPDSTCVFKNVKLDQGANRFGNSEGGTAEIRCRSPITIFCHSKPTILATAGGRVNSACHKGGHKRYGPSPPRSDADATSAASTLRICRCIISGSDH